MSQALMKKNINYISNQIINRIYGHGKGWVFTPDHFKDLGSRNAIGSALKRYKHEGVIRQLARGLYDFPKNDPQLGLLQPSTDAIAKALTGRDATRIQPTGAYAANLLGLTTQVPMKITFLTDGLSRTVHVDNRQITLKRTTPRNMATAGRVSGIVIQALRYIGRKNVDTLTIEKLNSFLDQNDKQQLLKDIRHAPAWIADLFRGLSVKETIE